MNGEIKHDENQNQLLIVINALRAENKALSRENRALRNKLVGTHSEEDDLILASPVAELNAINPTRYHSFGGNPLTADVIAAAPLAHGEVADNESTPLQDSGGASLGTHPTAPPLYDPYSISTDCVESRQLALRLRAEDDAEIARQVVRAAAVPNNAALRAIDEERREILAVLPVGTATQCPACGFVIERVSGDDKMMCGCAARVAGGTLEQALASGGCGHEFCFSTGAPLYNGYDTGSPGRPANDRQWKFRR